MDTAHAIQIAPLFGPWTFISEAESEAIGDRAVIHLTEAGVQLFNELPIELRSWACAWAFTFRSLVGGMHALSHLDDEMSDLLSAPEHRAKWMEKVSVSEIEMAFLIPHKIMEAEFLESLGINDAMSRPGGFISKMVDMQTGDPEKVFVVHPVDTDFVPDSKFIAKMLALERSLVARICFGCPMDELIQAAQSGDLQSLVNAVRVYPGVLAFSGIAKQFAEAAAVQDKKYLSRIAGAQINAIKRIEQYEMNINHCLSMLKKSGSLSRLNSKLAQLIFLETLPSLYPDDGESPVENMNRLVRRFKRNGRTFDIA